MAEDFEVQLRLPRSIEEGEIIEIKARIKHQVTTGLQLIETAKTPYERFVRNQPAVYLRSVEVFYDDELVSTFKMNSSTSNDPLLAFKLRASKQAPVRVVVTNYEGQIVETTEDITFS